jgi:hypothetical protein
MNAEEIKKEIHETRKAQQKCGFGAKNQNAAMFGKCERKLEELYRKLDQINK